jgi:hypothetical protein
MDFKVGDKIVKMEDLKLVQPDQVPLAKLLYTIISIEEMQDGNWHDGFATETVAILQNKLTSDLSKFTLCYMCPANLTYNIFAKKV